MASGDSLMTFAPLANRPPTANFSTLDLRGDLFVLDFDDSSNETAQFNAIVPSHYGGGEVVVGLTWTTTTATTGNVVLRVEVVQLGAGINLDTLPAASDSEEVTATAPAVNGNLVVSQTAPLTVSGLSAGGSLQIVVTRLASDAGDTIVGDIELFATEILEG